MKHDSLIFTKSKAVFTFLAFASLAFFTFLPVAYPEELDIKVVSLTSPVSPGNDATIVVNTAASATCQISVQYKSGASKAKGLSPKSADSQGNVSWTWRVDSGTAPGSWPVTVTCSTQSQKGETKTSFKGTLKTSLVVK